MRLEASLSRHDLINLFAQLLPLQITFDGADRYLSLSDPELVELVPDQGLRLACKAKISWPLLGASLPIALHRVTLRILPEIADNSVLVFRLALEHADFALVPDLVDNLLTDRINAELSSRSVALSWSFGASLTRHISLGTALAPSRVLHLEPAVGDVRVTPHALTMTVALRTEIRARKADS